MSSPIIRSPSEQASIILEQYPRINQVYTVFRGIDELYYAFHQEEHHTRFKKPLLLRLENEGGEESIGVYQFIGGVNPTTYRRMMEVEWSQSPFERTNNVVVRVNDGKSFENVRSLTSNTPLVGDQLIAIPLESKRAAKETGQIVTLSGVVVASQRVEDFKKYARQYDATEV